MAIDLRILGATAALALVAGCSTAGGGEASQRGTSVTRIHLGSAIARGEVAVEPRFTTQAAGGVYEPAFGTAVAGELRTLGFTPAANPAASEFVATVDVATGTGAALAARAPAPGAAPAAVSGDVASQLAVQLKRRSDGSIVWEGRARAPARAGSVPSASTVRNLARALFRDFPGESGRTILVR
jgi:hypothetical protein